jgi:heme exporter protein C
MFQETKSRSLISKHWWKATGSILVLYSIIAGLLGEVPILPILHESVRNLYFHVTMWFSMLAIFSYSLYYSIMYLSKSNIKDDINAEKFANTGILLGSLGVVTGSLWARFTWGAWWVSDPKLNGAAISILIYFAYVVLRNSMDEEQKRAKVAAVYNIFAFVLMLVFVMVYPRLNQVDSLHPGNGGNPGFSSYDLDKNMRIVFYPAVLGWILIGIWISRLSARVEAVAYKQMTISTNNKIDKNDEIL